MKVVSRRLLWVPASEAPPFLHKKKSKKQRKAEKRFAKRVVKYDFYRTREWLELRYQALQKYGHKCMCCGATPADGVRLHVDHVKPRSKYPELALSLDNMQIMCGECNIGKSNKDDTDYRLDEDYSLDAIHKRLRLIA